MCEQKIYGQNFGGAHFRIGGEMGFAHILDGSRSGTSWDNL